jgi:hypothetical protein
MPSTITWRGDAAAVAQVTTLTVGGTIEADDLFKITIGNKVLTVVAGSTVAATVASNIATAFNALTQTQAPEFFEISAAANGADVVLTAKTAGKPFTATPSTTETGGGAADDQTFTSDATTASAGPNDVSTAANYSGGVLPGNGDTLVIENNSSSLLYGLTALSSVTLASFNIARSFTGYVGLPRTNGSGNTAYAEYRNQYMVVGATAWNIGDGAGNGSQRMKLDFGSVQYAGKVYFTGTTAERDIPTLLLKGTHASNVLSVYRGDVGVAFFAGETSTIATLNINYVNNVLGDATVELGPGVTLTTVNQIGGRLTEQSNITTLNNFAGEVTIKGAATLATGTVGGTLWDRSSGTYTALSLLTNGKYDNTQGVAKTITDLSMDQKSSFLDPSGLVVLTNGVQLAPSCRPSDITFMHKPGLVLTYVP